MNADSRLAASRSSELAREIGKVYIGTKETIEMLFIALLARGHVLLEGVPGIAKTTLVKTFAETLGCSFKRIQFTPDLLPADITGTFVLNLDNNSFELRRGPIFANLVLGDEINRAPAKTQSALLEAMQEAQVTIDGQTELLPPPFMVLATQNPIEHEGVYMLPEAQLDRFLVRIHLGYPEFDQEQELLRTYNKQLETVQQILAPEEILALSEAAMQVFIDDELMDYVLRLVTWTREHNKVLLGASPRASLALMNCAKVTAFVQGRDFVLPDDIRFLAPYILEHRILMTPEAELEGTSSAQIVADAIKQVIYTDKAQTG
jgi:MoxR-like ATPase